MMKLLTGIAMAAMLVASPAMAFDGTDTGPDGTVDSDVVSGYDYCGNCADTADGPAGTDGGPVVDHAGVVTTIGPNGPSNAETGTFSELSP